MKALAISIFISFQSWSKKDTFGVILSVLGVTRYLCNALRNIITFVVPK